MDTQITRTKFGELAAKNAKSDSLGCAVVAH